MTWDTIKLADAPLEIIDGDRGKNYPKSDEFQKEGYCLFLSTANVREQGFDFSQCQFITAQKDEALRKGKLKRNDIVLTTRGTIGNVAYYSSFVPYENVRINSGMVILRADEKKLLSSYLYVFVRSPLFRSQTNSLRSGSAQPQLPIRDMKYAEIPIPPIETQLRIADIISSYDDLIENNQRRIRILEDMAQSLYSEWFVHFRFPGHEKTKMIDSPLGPIPQGWEAKALVDYAFVHRGRSYRSTDLEKPNGYPFANLKCIDRDGGFRKSGLKSYGGDFKETHKVVCGDIVMAVTDMTQERRIVARCGLVPTLPQPFGIISMDLVKIEPKDQTSKLYIYALLRWSAFADSVKQFANGANVLHLSPDHIKNYKCLWPDQDNLDSFVELITPPLELINNLNQQNEVLVAKRDLLLPKLISGEIELSAAASEFEEAA